MKPSGKPAPIAAPVAAAYTRPWDVWYIIGPWELPEEAKCID